MFTVLIGSYARGTAHSRSDIDIVRVDHCSPVPFYDSLSCNAYVSYIDYTIEEFSELHGKGSLFLQHMFLEGVLLDGSVESWNSYEKTFRPQTDFKREIGEYIEVLAFLTSNTAHSNAKIAFVFHVFRCLKNVAIFELAQKGVYVFDKSKSLELVFPELPRDLLKLMMDAEDIFERGAFESDSSFGGFENSGALFDFALKVNESYNHN